MEKTEQLKIIDQPQALEVVRGEVDPLEIIEKRDQLFKRVMSIAIASTTSGDWLDMQGRPYLQVSGCEKIARRFGVRISDIRQEREDLEDEAGKYYMYTTFGKATLGSGNESIETIGTCSSRDKFFGSAYGKLELTQDVDACNIKKKSFNNFLGNAITRLLGIRNLSWEDLSKHGINQNGKTSINYKTVSQKASDTKAATHTGEQAQKPYWTSEWEGKVYIHARTGFHFTSDFLENLDFRKSKKVEGQYSRETRPDIEAELEREYLTVEAGGKKL